MTNDRKWEVMWNNVANWPMPDEIKLMKATEAKKVEKEEAAWDKEQLKLHIGLWEPDQEMAAVGGIPVSWREILIALLLIVLALWVD